MISLKSIALFRLLIILTLFTENKLKNPDFFCKGGHLEALNFCSRAAGDTWSSPGKLNGVLCSNN